MTPFRLGPAVRDVARGVNREAVAGLVGAPVDMATMLMNLGIAGGGYAAHKLGLVDRPPELIDPARAVGSSDWMFAASEHCAKRIQKALSLFLSRIKPPRNLFRALAIVDL